MSAHIVLGKSVKHRQRCMRRFLFLFFFTCFCGVRFNVDDDDGAFCIQFSGSQNSSGHSLNQEVLKWATKVTELTFCIVYIIRKQMLLTLQHGGQHAYTFVLF